MTCDWRSFPADCDICGGETEVFTDMSLDDGEAYEDNVVRCKGCKARGTVLVEEDGSITINWEEGIA